MEMNRIDSLIKDRDIYYDEHAIDGWVLYSEREMTLTDGSDLHLLDTFVRHFGGVSFGDSKSPRERAAMETLRRLHPKYETEVLRFVREDPARLTGERDGRRFIVTLRRRSGRHGTSVETWIEVPVTTTLHLQVQAQTSDLGASIAGDQRTGDAAFDAACLLRSTEPEVAARALDEAMQATLVAGFGAGDLTLLVVDKQWLRLELRGAPDAPENEPMVTHYLDVALTLARRLDA